jgi:hypothetical protein
LHFAAAVSEFGDDELLRDAGHHAFCRSDREARKYQPGTAIPLRLIEVRKSSESQVASHAGVVRLPFAE